MTDENTSTSGSLNKSDQLPVIVLTGFLGSGKTTLLNSTLSHSFQSHGGPSIARCLGFLPQAVALSDDLGEFSRRHVSSG